jgi:hypothetical protein
MLPKHFRSILLARSREGIYWLSSSTIREGIGCLRKASVGFYWHGIMIVSIEWELSHDKIRNLMVYERLRVDFIGTESWWYLLKGRTSTIKEGTCPFTKSTDEFYWKEVVMTFIKGVIFQNKTRNLTIYEKLLVDFIGMESWCVYRRRHIIHKRTNLIVKERHPVDFIGMVWWWNLLNGDLPR